MDTLRRVTALTAILLIVGAGLCLFDAEHGTGGDLCSSLLVTTIGLLAATMLVPAGRCLPTLAPVYHLYLPDPSAPPPRV